VAGVAEEQMAGKAFFVRAGVFKDVDVTLFTHVATSLACRGGAQRIQALLSAEFRFKGSSAHAAGAPWRGKSALDAVMLMAQAWEYRREHLRAAAALALRDQATAATSRTSSRRRRAIWFYFREQDHRARWRCSRSARRRWRRGAAMMTDTKLDTIMILGSGWSSTSTSRRRSDARQHAARRACRGGTRRTRRWPKSLQRETGGPDFGLSDEGLLDLRGSEARRTWMWWRLG
jgi:aminobenzoyl-glutamate utilization protein B